MMLSLRSHFPTVNCSPFQFSLFPIHVDLYSFISHSITTSLMELQQLEVDAPDSACMLSGDPWSVAPSPLRSNISSVFGSNNSWILDCTTATMGNRIHPKLSCNNSTDIL